MIKIADEGEFVKSDGDPFFASEADSSNGILTTDAGENLTAFDAVYIKGTDGEAYIADTGTADDARCDGIVLNTATASNECYVQTEGIVQGMSSLTDKEVYYLAAAGATSTTQNNFRIGVAIGTTKMKLMLSDYTLGVPIGAIIAWHLSLTGVPSVLPANFALMDGSTISDTESPMNGQTLRDLNANNEFLRGGDTSGGTGGSATHNHGNDAAYAGNGAFTPADNTSQNHEPPYMDAVWVIRIK